MSKFVRFEGVKKVYRMGEVEIEALRDATFAVEKGELCVIVGPSGAGKTTLLNILGGMDTLTEGRVFLGDEEVSAYTPRQLTAYRRHDIGFVFQFYNLVPNLTALENVELAAQICKHPLNPEEVLRSVGLGERLGNFPAQLSGGEQQGSHCPGSGEESPAAAVRRAHRGTGLPHGQIHPEAFAADEPEKRHDGGHHHP